MRRVYLLIMVLVATAAGTSLAGWAPHAASGAALAPIETRQRAAAQDCVDDVSVTVLGLADINNGYVLLDPPDYADGDDIRIYYDVSNSSCRDVKVTVELKGSVTGATIHNIDDTDDMACLEGCTISADDPVLNGNVGWDLAQHPNATEEKVIATVTVSAPDGFVDANQSNNSATSTDAINIVNEEPDPAPDISVKSVTASKSTVVVGEVVDFTIVVLNEGDADAETTVILDHGADTAELSSETVSVLAAGSEKTVTLSWDTNGAEAGEHTLRVLAQTEGDDNADNDSMTASVSLVEPSVDVAVTSVKASVTEALVGDTVDFTVTLENRGNVVAATPAVSLFDADGAEDAAPLASVTAPTIAVGDETKVSISWDTSESAAGEYRLRAVAMVADDDDSTNDSANTTLTLHNQVDVSLSFSDAIGPTAISGSTVQIGFTLNNTGDHATGVVTVSLYVTAEGEERGEQEPTATASVETLAGGGSSSGALAWDTAAVTVGDYELEAVAETAGDIDETNNSVSAGIEIRNWLLLKSVSPQSKEVVTGDTIEYTAQVENVGRGELTGVTVGLYESGVNEALASATIDSLVAGRTEDVNIEWNTSGQDAGQVHLVVAARADGQVAEEDDTQWVNVTIRNPIELSAATPASEDNIAGTPVSINAQVLNESVAEVTGVAVNLDGVEDCQNKDREKKNGCAEIATIATISAGEKGLAVLEWDTAGVATGKHELKVIASMDSYSADDNDERSLTISLREPVIAVELSSATINRSVSAIGQTLDVVAKITNHGEVPVAAPVTLYTIQNLHETTAVARETSPLIEPGSSAEVTLRWDTTGKPSGKYDLRVSVDLPDDTTPNDNTSTLTVELFPSAFEGDDAPETCREDVRVTVDAVKDIAPDPRASPDYQVGEALRIAYTAYNYSCDTDVEVAVTMTGPGGKSISGAGAPCFDNCTALFGARVTGEAQWTIPTLPASINQPINASVTVISPSEFVEADEANNSAESTDRINIVHPDDVVLRLREQNDNKVSTRQSLTGPEFGAVDVRLVSVDPLQTTLPFADETVELAVAVANDGATTEPTAVRVILVPDDGTDPKELYRRTMVVPASEAKSTSLAVPVTDVPPGAHTVEVLLSAAVDQSPGNNAATFEFTRLEPLVGVELLDVSVSPEVPMLGDDATVSLMVHNKSEIALPLTLHLYVGDESDPTVTKTLDELAPESQSEQQITWSIPASGKHLGRHKLRLDAVSEKYGRVADSQLEVIFHIDAEIVEIRSSPDDTAMQGQAVSIEVDVQNNGPATANVPVVVRLSSDTTFTDERRPPVPSRSTGTARFTWRTRDYKAGEHTIRAEVPSEHNIATDKKSMELPFRINPLVVTATIMDVSAYPTAPMVGEPVSIAVTVRNDGPIAASIPITLHFPPGGRQSDSRKPHLYPDETGTVVFEWRTGNYRPGTHRFRIEVAAVGNPAEYLDVELSPPVVNATIVDVAVNPEIPRLGEPVTVSVTVRNDGWIPTNIPVTLHFPSDEKLPETQRPRVEPGAVGSVAFTWRTSRYEPGMHDFRVEVANNPPASQRFEVELLPPIVDVAIVGMGSDPSESAVKGQAVKIWVDVINNGPSALNVPVQLAFPSSDKQPERKSTRVEPGQTARVEFVWKTANYDVGTHRLTATLMADYNIAELDTSATIQIALVPAQLTASIIDISWSPESPAVGEPVSIAVTVRNDGIVAASIPVTLHFPPGGRQPETRSLRIDPGHTGTTTFDWLTGNFAVGTHQFRVQLVDGDIADQRFTIDLLPTVENVAIVGMGTYPVETAMVGEPVEVWVDLRNDGLVALNIPVRLTFPSASKRPEVQSPRVGPGETVRVWFEWKTSKYKPGIHTLSAAVLLDNNITLGRTTEEIRFALTPLKISATIVDVAVNPEEPRVGEAVTITATVRNDGRIAANIPVTLHFPPGGRQPETRSHRIDPGATGEVSFMWRTSRYEPGMHDFRVEVVSDPPASQRFEVELLPPIVDVAIVGMGSDPSESAVKGQAVKIWVDVINNGPSALNVPVQLAFPSDEKLPVQASSRIEPGKTARVEFVWKTANYDVGTHRLTATLMADYNIAELDASATIQIALVPAQLMASIIDISWSPESPAVGEPVRIAVTVRNDGIVAASIPVTLHFPPGGRQPETRSPHMRPGQTETATFDWLTGNFAVGTHQFRVELAAVDGPDQRFTIDLLPTVENVAIVGMGTYPAETAMVGEPVEVWIDLRNDGPVTLNVPVRLRFPSGSKRPEVQSPRVGPGETARVWFEWKTPKYNPGIHTLSAAILLDNNITLGHTTEEIRFALTPLIISATIVDVAVNPEEPRVGEAVTITATVRNDGRIAANIPVTLHFPPGGRQPETQSHRINPGATGEVSFTWRTIRYQPGAQAFIVEVASDPPSTRQFTVELLPPIVDVAIIGMGSDPSESAVKGQAVKIWVDVINNGTSALNVPVELSFPSDEKKPQGKSIRITPGETERVTFIWKTSTYEPGFHTLDATIDLAGNVTQGSTYAELQFLLTPSVITATVLDISASPEAPRVGEPVTITVTVRNDGIVAANIPVTLRFPSDDKQPETRRPHVKPGATAEARFTWRTGRYPPGLHSFVAEVASTPPSARPFTIELRPALVNVSIVGMGSDPAESAIRGQHVKVWVDVINNGPSALNVPVQLAFPSDEKRPERKSPRIEPGQTARVEFTWKTSNYGAGEHLLTATLVAEHNITELAKSATIRIRLVSPRLADSIAASIVDTSWHPASPVVGEAVSIEVTVRNDGIVAVRIPVTLHFPSADKQPETKRPRVAPGAVGTASFTWRTSRYEPGDHVFRVQIPGAFRTFEIELRPPEVDFAVVSFQTPDPMHPIVKGDWVEITVVLQNQGPYSGRGTVYLLNGANADAMYEQSASLEPGEFREVEFTWKTLRYPVGAYELLARVDAEHDTDRSNDRSDLAPVHLLTDRDITVGFGSAVRPAVFAEPTSKVSLSSMPLYRNDISVVGNSHTPVDRPIAAASDLSMGVSPQPANRNSDPVRMYWWWRSAQKSPWQCARLQQTVGESLPRAVVCPKAPALVR